MKTKLTELAKVCGAFLLFAALLWFGSAKMVSFELSPPDNTPVLVSATEHTIFAPTALQYDSREYWVNDTFGPVSSKKGKPLKGGLSGFNELRWMSYGDAVKKGYKPDSKHREYLRREGNTVIWTLYRLGLRREPWTPKGDWRELRREAPL
jgi:hypothetical protein